MKDANKIYQSDTHALPLLRKTPGGISTSTADTTSELFQPAGKNPSGADAKKMITKLIGHLKDNI